MAGFDYQGKFKRVLTFGDGITSWDSLVSTETGNRVCQNQLVALAKRLADFGKLKSPQQFRSEGQGIFAIKARCGLRAYGWMCTHETKGACFVIGRVVMKKKDKADPSDLDYVESLKSTF